MHLPNPLSLPFFLVCFLYYSATPINAHFSINCGGISGRKWSTDANPELSSLLQIKGSSIASRVIPGFISAVDHDLMPYGTARFSYSRFSYEFRINPGEKIVRLHFNSAPYEGFRRFRDFFDVKFGPFTLLANFSVSLMANALGVNSFVKEFCIKLEEHHLLSVTFSAATNPLFDTYAFINGIEIISVPSSHSYFHVENDVLQMVGKSLVYVGTRIAYEIVSRLNARKDPVSPFYSGFNDLFGMWDTVSGQRDDKTNNIKWRVSVDVGFRYLVKLYFSRIGFERGEIGDFRVCINGMFACTDIDMAGERDGKDGVAWHRDFVVTMNGYTQEGKRDILVYLETSDELMDARELLEGYEVLKLSNIDNSLASPNRVPASQDLSSQSVKNLLQVLGQKNVAAFFAIAILLLLNIPIWIMQKILENSAAEEENMPSARAERLCRRFSLAEIKLATGNFSDARIIGRGGFGNVYKGLIDDGQKIVAIKRLKSSSSQGAHEFLTEIDTLTELRHVNLVSLIGYCRERREMILVYEYMPRGTLSSHVFKLTWDSGNHAFLNWKQRLNLCIGTGRGLEYLHTGCSLIHRDVKASNILLDEDFVPKVSDFGLAKYLCRKELQSHVSTKVKGTRGYLDPYYLSSGRLTAKSDVYAFGVVLLEVLSGRPAIDPGVLMEERILTKWAQVCISQGKEEEIVAFDLKGEISGGSLKAFVQVAASCLHEEPKKRPTMAKVVQQLEYALEQQDISVVPAPDERTCPVDSVLSMKNDGKTSADLKQVTSHSTVSRKTNLPMKGETNNKVVYSIPPPRSKGWRKITLSKTSRFWRWNAFGKKQRSRSFNVFSPLIRPEDLVFLDREEALASLEVIRKDRCGEVFKAVILATGKEIAIKKIIQPPRDAEDLINEDSKVLTREMRQIQSEIITVGQISHRNVLPLLAHLPRPDCHYLVYEYMKNGSLQDFLQRVAQGKTMLDWFVRYKIALGVAAGLEYLHTHHTGQIIHRDLKPGNILLDNEMEPQIADFGVAKAVPDSHSHVTTSQIEGTVGYIAPEYYQTFKFSDKCDMYTFGVVLGVLMMGKLPSDDFFQHTDEMNMVRWMRNVMCSEDPKRAIDPELLGNGYEEQMLLVLRVACFCTMDDPKERPSSKEARRMLSQIME